MNEYLTMFIDETREHLQAWSDGMLTLEKHADAETIATIFRAAHTIKGMAMTMGFTRMGEVTHKAENLLDEVRQGKRVVDSELVDTLFHSLDVLESLLADVEETAQEREEIALAAAGTQAKEQVQAALVEQAAGAVALAEQPASAPADAAGTNEIVRSVAHRAMEQGRRVYELRIGFAPECVMPMARFAQLLQRVDQNELLMTIPDAAVLEQGDYTGEIVLVLATLEDVEALLGRVTDISELEIETVREWRMSEAGAAEPSQNLLPSTRITEDDHVVKVVQAALKQGKRVYEVGVRLHVDTVLKSARMYMVFEAVGGQDQLLYTRPGMREIEDEAFSRDVLFVMWSTEEVGAIKRAVEGVADIELVQLREWTETDGSAQAGPNLVQGNARSQKGEAKAKKASATVRVDVDKLDLLMNLFSEIAIDKTRFESLAAEFGDARLVETVAHMSRATNDLQELIMSIRMIPVGSVFQRFPRMVRDTARSLGKAIEFTMSGEETELDRMVVEELADPLMHLLRNSLDHGIEAGKDRRQRGKEETGQIALRAYPVGNRVVIEVEDDGGGIDRARVLRKAVERGLVSASESEGLSDAEVYRLLFASGFSTADTVTDLSGRGVGLDVVKSKIESLSGRVEVESQEGQGTKFTITLPVTLALLQSIMVRIDEHPFAVPLAAIEEIQEEPESRRLGEQEVVVWRGQVTPLVRARTTFGLGVAKERGHVLYVMRGREHMGLVVDDVVAQQEVVLKPLPKAVKDVAYFAGATILGDGQVALVLDPGAF
ncbi:chemotaxis protein CheW [Sulfoacidibacillus thermotolerans]|uniref:Chemotaxis protein CheA n=1 Tax=Sulfoacidibacillus thermotolerans TaxID=1765684 RepID=A0A2U3DAR6_SULT2|nr:chemotaxis protein CheW [Sulfoacidibacillus thermotolerans]PWI58374.1 hypothetical protein BM613_03920 [Sulfoacidibacillus thermotolerans]